MKYEIQQMLTQGAGVIINNSSMGGLIAFPGISPYNASKHAVMGLTRAAALDYAKQGIRINAINPGLIATEMMDRLTDSNSEQLASLIVPMGRMGQPEEIATTVVSLCSLFFTVVNITSLEGLKMDIGFIGIGSMGAAMVPNLVKVGHQVSYPFQEATL